MGLVLDAIGKVIAGYLQKEVPGYESFSPSDPEHLRGIIAPGETRRVLGLALLDGFAVFVDDGFRLADRIAVEGGIGEHARRGAGIVDDVEGELAVVGAQAGAATDDLLELGHRADSTGQHHILAGRRIDAGGQKLRCGEDDRSAGLDILELRQVATADVALVGGDAADIVRVPFRWQAASRSPKPLRCPRWRTPRRSCRRPGGRWPCAELCASCDFW